jgi:hypothetical protein
MAGRALIVRDKAFTGSDGRKVLHRVTLLPANLTNSNQIGSLPQCVVDHLCSVLVRVRHREGLHNSSLLVARSPKFKDSASGPLGGSLLVTTSSMVGN